MQPPLSHFASTLPGTQDAQIISEIEWRYGSYLERLTREEKLALRSVLSKYIYYQTFLENYLISDAITDTMPDLEATICEAMVALEGISLRIAEMLIKFVTDQSFLGD